MGLKLHWGVFFRWRTDHLRLLLSVHITTCQWAGIDELPIAPRSHVLFYNGVLKENHGQKASPPLDCSWCVCVCG